MKQQLNDANGELAKARKLLLADAIDAADFKAMKAESEEKVARLERRIGTMSEEFNSVELKQLMDKATSAISNLNILYHDVDFYFKRDIVSAIYPQKLEHDGYQFRTTHFNKVIANPSSPAASPKNKKADKMAILPSCPPYIRGLEQIRTAVEAFAELCLATRPRDQNTRPFSHSNRRQS